MESRLTHNVTGWSYIRGYFAGMGWAKADLAESRAVIFSPQNLDKETGLRDLGIDCVADHGMDGVIDGYKRIVRLWVRLKGPFPYSRKRWEGMLFHLTEYFDKRMQTEPPEHFIVNGNPILASDGVTKVFLKSRQFHEHVSYLIMWDTKIRSPFYSPLAGANSGPIEFSTWPMWPKEGLILYYPGPPGSDLLLLRGQAGRTKEEMTAAFDMRYGFFLHYEPSSF